MKRRSFLHAAVASSAVLGGCSAFSDVDLDDDRDRGPESTPQPGLPEGVPDIDGGFDEVINVVDAGADPTGETEITELLDENLGGGTLLLFPSGTYRLSSARFENRENTGMIAAADADVKLVPAEPSDVQGPRWLWFSGVRGFLFDGLNIDFRGERQSGRVMVTGPGDFVFRNCRVLGRYVTPSAFRFDVRDPDHNALIENVTALGVDELAAESTGIYVGRLHAGEITVRNCRLENFPDNGIYASAPGGHGGSFPARDGTVHVDGGVFRNNNIANVRLGSTGSTVRNVTIVVDEVPPHFPGDRNSRGIRLRGKRDQLVENCHIQYGPEAGSGFGAIVVHTDNGRATVRDTTIRMDRDGMPAISAAQPSAAVRREYAGPAGVRFENVQVTGTAGEAASVTISGRDRTEFRDCRLIQRGVNRDGFVFSRSNDCVVRNTDLMVTGQPFRLDNASVTRENVRTF